MEELRPHGSQRPARSAGAEPWASFEYFRQSDEDKALGLFRLVEETGKLSSPGAIDWIDAELARRLFRGMLTIRVVDQRMIALQRQGQISFYGEAVGQEASVVGSAAAMEAQDWLVPALREAGAGLYRGLPLSAYVAQTFGNAADVTRGRQMPCHPCDRQNNYVVMSSCVGSQIPHAVGIAMGMKLSGKTGEVCVGYMGDGATSEADFHVAMNFAGVTRAPVVLICANNQWAISTPGTLQTAAPTIAIKGVGYGVESLRVDGNDVCAVYLACRYATEKARRGEGPTFVELLTYRVSAHSTSDDPSRYRDESVTQVWRTQRDPLVRMDKLCTERGWLAPGEAQGMAADIEAEVREVIAAQAAIGSPAVSSLIEDVFEQPTWLLRDQLDELVRSGSGSQGGNGR